MAGVTFSTENTSTLWTGAEAKVGLELTARASEVDGFEPGRGAGSDRGATLRTAVAGVSLAGCVRCGATLPSVVAPVLLPTLMLFPWSPLVPALAPILATP
jgi:hypothetical protein